MWVAPNGALVDSIKQRLRAIVLRRRASGIHGAVTANGRNDLYRHWHFLVRIERRFYYEILTDGAYCKIVTMPAESHEVADDVAIPETRKIPTTLHLYRHWTVFLSLFSSFSLFFYTRVITPEEQNLVGVPRFQRIDCFSYGGENTLYINERPARPKTRLTTRRYLWPWLVGIV